MQQGAGQPLAEILHSSFSCSKWCRTDWFSRLITIGIFALVQGSRDLLSRRYPHPQQQSLWTSFVTPPLEQSLPLFPLPYKHNSNNNTQQVGELTDFVFYEQSLPRQRQNNFGKHLRRKKGPLTRNISCPTKHATINTNVNGTCFTTPLCGSPPTPSQSPPSRDAQSLTCVRMCSADAHVSSKNTTPLMPTRPVVVNTVECTAPVERTVKAISFNKSELPTDSILINQTNSHT